jgi:hypothetical protein
MPTEVFGDSSDNEPGETPVQLFAAGSPHGLRAAQKLDLPDTPAAELLRSLLLTTAATEDTATAPASVFGGTGSGGGGGGALDPLRVLFNFGEHGREIISSEVALQLVHMLDMEAQQALPLPPPILADAAADKAETAMAAADPASHLAGTRELDPLFTAWLLSHARVVLLPLLNVWSHQRVEEGELCQRKNKRQVDLNRNWDFLWDGLPPSSSSSSRTNAGDIKRRQQQRRRHNANPNDEQYGGTEPFSEVESRVLRDVAQLVRPNLFVNVHSGITEMYCGWDWKQELIPNGAEALRVLQAMRPHCASKSSDCPIGGAGIIGGYVVFGGSMDYLYTQLNTSHSLTIEVFGGERGVDPRECFAFFNPTTAARLEHTKRRWARALVEAVAFLVAEKKDVEFPWKKERWMVGQRAVQRELHQAAATTATTAGLPQNFYSRFDELVARLDAIAGVQMLRLLPSSSTSLSPFEPLSPSDGADAAAEAATEKPHPATLASKSNGGGWSSLLFGGSAGKPAAGGMLLRARPRWNDACTPFLPGLPRAVVGALESRAQAQQQQQQRRTAPPPTHMSQWLLPAWTVTTPTTHVHPATNTEQDTINVLLIGGAAWNDLLSTELLCGWVEEAAASAAASASSSSSKQQLVPSVKLFLLPSLFASARMTLLETPSLHAGLCSATLSADHRASLLAHQLYATEALGAFMQEVVRPRIIVLLEADSFVNEKQFTTTGSTSSGGEPSTAARSLMHVEAVALQQDAALDRAVADAAATARRRAGDAHASWSVTSLAQVLEARKEKDLQRQQQGQCAIGRIDVLELLLPQQPQHSPLCPSCQLLFRVHMHGVLDSVPAVASSTSAVLASAPGGVAAAAAALSPSQALLDAELAEAVAAEQEALQRAVRAKDDRVAPDVYLRSAAAAANDASSPSSSSSSFSSSSTFPGRSMRMAQFASERASSSSSPQQRHWCDFHTRNVAPHSPHNVLALHVEQSKGVWAALREAINDLVASGALLHVAPIPTPPAVAAAAPVRPVFVGVEEPVELLAAGEDSSARVSRTAVSSNGRGSSSSHTLQLIRLEDGAGFASHRSSADGLLSSLALPSLLSLLLLGVVVLTTLAFVLVRRRRRQRRHSGATVAALAPGTAAKRGALGAGTTAAAAAAAGRHGTRISPP